MQHLFNRLFSAVNDVMEVFYPRTCAGCDAHLMRHEPNLCLFCLHGLPKTYFWDYDVNPVETIFWGKLEVSSACAFLHFIKESKVQRLLHRFKYGDRPEIGQELGKAFAHILMDKKWFVDADVIIPIPLHPSKQLRRGYNQSAYIAEGMSEVLNIPTRKNALKRLVASESQTRKSRYDRTENVERVFKVDQISAVRGKNVLLVDDVVTTGSTLVAAGQVLLEAGASRLYIATLATA